MGSWSRGEVEVLGCWRGTRGGCWRGTSGEVELGAGGELEGSLRGA